MTIHYTKVSSLLRENPRDYPDALDAPSGLYCVIGKRSLDLFVVFLSLPFVIPLVILLALLIAHDGANPFYCQLRIGRKGRVYKMWKMRTMVPNAEALLEAHLESDPEARAEWSHAQKLKLDPRITRFGACLRKTSLDELPQLWNVIRGDMSLVGPRPMMVDQRILYPGQYYETMWPGITGPWQVSSRNNSSFSDRADFDAHYYANISLKTDLRLLFATCRVVLRGTGY